MRLKIVKKQLDKIVKATHGPSSERKKMENKFHKWKIFIPSQRASAPLAAEPSSGNRNGCGLGGLEKADGPELYIVC
jgi:hypothetical protein